MIMKNRKKTGCKNFISQVCTYTTFYCKNAKFNAEIAENFRFASVRVIFLTRTQL